MNNLEKNEKWVWSSCNVNCGNRCPLRLYVKDGKVVRVEPDNTGEDPLGAHNIRACLRGRALRKWVYSPDRLLYPLKRVGKRGEGKFKRISWDNAFDYIADKLRKVIDIYGNEAVFRIYGTGNIGGVVSSREQIDRLMNMLGGQLSYHNNYSTAQISHGIYYTYGINECGNPLSEIVNSKLVVLFGNNPVETRMSGSSVYNLIKSMKNSRAYIIIIDPRYSDTAACFADEWIPIRPGTDAALVSGLAYVLIVENMVDKDFLKRYCIGYDQSTMPHGIPSSNSYKDYILGMGKDRIPKTPAWASSITGIPTERIVQLARQLGKIKPTYISQGWGPQRHANGENTARAICMLPILTGNIGIKGGNSGDGEAAKNIEFPKIPAGANPINTSIPCFLWTKAIADHENFTDLTDGLKGNQKLETPIKFIWCFASNILMNQHSDIRATHSILSDERLCEMIVLIDNVMTASARYADIVLPGTSSFEEIDLAYQGHADNMNFLILRQQAIDPMGECRTIFEICSEIAKRMGVEQEFTEGRSHDQWVEHMYYQCRKVRTDLPETYGDAVRKGVFKWKGMGNVKNRFELFRENPDESPLNTPSGKIEIFSKQLWDISRKWKLVEGDMISAIPKYHETWGMPSKVSTRKYPLQLIGHHCKQRTHSSYGNNPLLQESIPQSLWINPLNAESRSIAHGDIVRVYNQIGQTEVRANVTQRIMPGVLSLPQGAWYTPDENGIDKNGSINILTSQRPSPLAKGNPQHTNLVEVEKV